MQCKQPCNWFKSEGKAKIIPPTIKPTHVSF